MDTIFIEGLVFSGRHGVGAPERAKHQRFGLDITMKQKPLDWQEDITRTNDYLDAKEIARSLVEERSFKLLETLAEAICREVLKKPIIELVTVTIRKLDLMPPATCGVTIERSRASFDN